MIGLYYILIFREQPKGSGKELDQDKKVRLPTPPRTVD